MEEKDDFETSILIGNITNKKYVLDYGHKFLASKGLVKSYRLMNTKNSVNFIVQISSVAYELMKYFEEGKQNDKNLKDIDIELTILEKGSQSETFYDSINKHKFKDNSNNNKNKASKVLKQLIQKDDEVRNEPYFIRHTKDIAYQAGVISQDSPYKYLDMVKKMEEKESRKKDISSKKFNHVLSKYQPDDIKNDNIPIGNIHDFKFRDEYKDKWIHKGGFQSY